MPRLLALCANAFALTLTTFRFAARLARLCFFFNIARLVDLPVSISVGASLVFKLLLSASLNKSISSIGSADKALALGDVFFLRALLALGSFLFTVRLLFRAPLDFFFTITREALQTSHVNRTIRTDTTPKAFRRPCTLGASSSVLGRNSILVLLL